MGHMWRVWQWARRMSIPKPDVLRSRWPYAFGIPEILASEQNTAVISEMDHFARLCIHTFDAATPEIIW